MHQVTSSQSVVPTRVADHIPASSTAVAVVMHHEAAVGAFLIEAKVAMLLLIPLSMFAFLLCDLLPDLRTLLWRDNPPFHVLDNCHSTALFDDKVLLRPQVALALLDGLALRIVPRLTAAVAEVVATAAGHVVAAMRQLNHYAALATCPPAFAPRKLEDSSILIGCRVLHLPLRAAEVWVPLVPAGDAKLRITLGTGVLGDTRGDAVEVDELGTPLVGTVHLADTLYLLHSFGKFDIIRWSQDFGNQSDVYALLATADWPEAEVIGGVHEQRREASATHDVLARQLMGVLFELIAGCTLPWKLSGPDAVRRWWRRHDTEVRSLLARRCCRRILRLSLEVRQWRVSCHLQGRHLLLHRLWP
mmetsp:Transcript_33136/g.72218  ORF Transcript_33136/g.72218 Transcript_33136/m.72218 type:complete len:360 (-) Transcript_33136:791-1870(-)